MIEVIFPGSTILPELRLQKKDLAPDQPDSALCTLKVFDYLFPMPAAGRKVDI
jgi:hypothetical protein